MAIDAKQIELLLPILRGSGFIVTYCHSEKERSCDAGRASQAFIEAGLIAAEDLDTLTKVLTHSTWQTTPPVGITAVTQDKGSIMTSLRRATI